MTIAEELAAALAEVASEFGTRGRVSVASIIEPVVTAVDELEQRIAALEAGR